MAEFDERLMDGDKPDDFVVCVGYDHREIAAWHVCVHSIMKRASKPVLVMPLMLNQLNGMCGEDPRGSTEFSISRFLTPHLARSRVSLFVDCDFVFLDDVWKLYDIARANNYIDVFCVRHDYRPHTKTKFYGAEQHVYPRKNWSSLMLFNGHRTAVNALRPDAIRGMSPSELHQMLWARAIGSIPIEWNWLVGEYEDRPAAELKGLHYTLGGPWFGVESAYADLWRRELKEITG